MEPTDWYPRRDRVRGFLTPEPLDRIGKALPGDEWDGREGTWTPTPEPAGLA